MRGRKKVKKGTAQCLLWFESPSLTLPYSESEAYDPEERKGVEDRPNMRGLRDKDVYDVRPQTVHCEEWDCNADKPRKDEPDDDQDHGDKSFLCGCSKDKAVNEKEYYGHHAGYSSWYRTQFFSLTPICEPLAFTNRL